MTLAVVALAYFSWLTISKIFTRRAKQNLINQLFPNGDNQLADTMKSIHSLTRGRFSEEDVLDYYLKIKGLQAINLSDPISFWTRRYLLQPTRIRLNYFEQVKFYESFLNYPEIHGKQEVTLPTVKPRKHIYAKFELA